MSATKKVVKETVKQETKETEVAAPPKPEFWDVEDPFVALHDFVTGKVFDGPKAAVTEATKEVTHNGNPNLEEEPSVVTREHVGPSSININLGDVFRRPKRKPVSGGSGSGAAPVPKKNAPPEDTDGGNDG